MAVQRSRTSSMNIRHNFTEETSEFDKNKQRMAETVARLAEICEKMKFMQKEKAVIAVSAGAGVGATVTAGVGGVLGSGMLTGGMLGAATGFSVGLAGGLTAAATLASGGVATGAALAGIHFYRKRRKTQAITEAQTLVEELIETVRLLQGNMEAFRSFYKEINKDTTKLVQTQTQIQESLSLLQDFTSEPTVERLLVVSEQCRRTVEEVEQLRSDEDFLSLIVS